MSAAERRSFFRVYSEIVLDFHSVDSFTFSETRVEDQFPEQQQTMDLLGELRRLDRDATPQLAAIGEFNRSLAEYLKTLNKKLDLIARQCVAADYLNEEVRPSHVNLSEGGIAFNCSKALYRDSQLALRIMFVSDYSSITSFAKVVRCDSNEDSGGFKVACKFVALDDSKRELLSKHIMQAQLAARRQQH